MMFFMPEKAGTSRRIAKLLRTLPVVFRIAYTAVMMFFMPEKAGSSRRIAKLLRTLRMVFRIA